MLRDLISADTPFGSDKLQTLLVIVPGNATTDSPWALSNTRMRNTTYLVFRARNTDLPLWQLVRASTAAPDLLSARGQEGLGQTPMSFWVPLLEFNQEVLAQLLFQRCFAGVGLPFCGWRRLTRSSP